ncbi:hypothetical protein GCM10020256_71180 [Streptomyces thermocoprophilus]
MRSTQAKDHPADGPPTGPRLLPVPGSPARPSTYGADGPATGPVPAHPGDGTDHTGPVRPPALHGVGREHPGPDGTLGSPAGTVDADVPAAVGRVLDELLSGRLHHARLVDPLFAEDIAGRVAAFTRHGGKRIRAHLVWWSFRACGGTGPDAASAALRLGAAVELLQTCALVHDDVMDQAVLRRGRPPCTPRRAPASPGVRPPNAPGGPERPRRSSPGTSPSRGPTTWSPRHRCPPRPEPSCADCGATCAPRWSPASTSTCTARPPALGPCRARCAPPA